jgi:hypothetical protein
MICALQVVSKRYLWPGMAMGACGYVGGGTVALIRVHSDMGVAILGSTRNFSCDMQEEW